MLYSEARQLIASGDLLAFTSNAFLSSLIRHATGGSYSHIGIAWRYRDRLYLLNAREGAGVELQALSAQLPFHWISTGVRWGAVVEEAALAHLGEPYSYLDAVRVWLGREPQHSAEVCSVYAAMVLRTAGFDLPLPSYTPSALVEAVLARGADLRLIIEDSQ
jgi:hypothetical protein